jgi:hypothetical protein
LDTSDQIADLQRRIASLEHDRTEARWRRQSWRDTAPAILKTLAVLLALGALAWLAYHAR